MRGFLDRDFLRTVEGFLFCVVGCIHPRDRVFSYLKYAPSPEGKWGGGGISYSRTMRDYTIPSLAANLEDLAKRYPHYIFHSQIFNINMSAVPTGYITEHYLPEKKLKDLFNSKRLDPLQERALQLVSYLSEEASIPKDCFGVTGSILTDIHNPLFSDIDLVIYGIANGWRIKRFLQREYETGDGVLARNSGRDLFKLLNRWVKSRPLSLEEAEEIYKRRWNYGFFKEKPFSIHTVKTRGEVMENYGDKVFVPIKIVEGEAEITDVKDSLSLPCTYGVKFLEASFGVDVGRIVSYDGFYGGIFELGDRVRVKGKLERVIDRHDGRFYYRILIGSLEAHGEDYIKPLQEASRESCLL